MATSPRTLSALDDITAARIAYTRERLNESLEHFGVGEEIFTNNVGQLPRQDHVVAARIKVFERTLEPRDEGRVYMRDIDRVLGQAHDYVSGTLRMTPRRPVLDDDEAWKIVEDALAATGATKHDFRRRNGNIKARDKAVVLMRTRQPNGARLSLKRIAFMMFQDSSHSIVMDSLRRARKMGVAA